VETREAVDIREVPWTDDTTKLLAHPAARACLSWLEREVRGRVAQLWECRAGGKLAHVVTRLDENPREWVICYARGSGLALFMPAFLRVADAKRWPVRIHCESRGMVRMCERYGFAVREFVLRR
jgi:hypothetical protein